MDKLRYFITLIVILISLIIIDEGKVNQLAGNDILILLNHNEIEKTEIPYIYSFYGADDDLTWISSSSCELKRSSGNILLFSCYSTFRTMEFAGFIWQPPESL